MIKIIESILWAIATVMIVYSGLYFTIKLRFVQIRFKDMFKSIKNKTEGAISPFQSLMMVLGAKIGVGSIAGIALAIYLGGPGTVFWIWIIGFLSTSTTFAETVLGVRYNEYDGNKIYKGGPNYYLKKGLNKKNLSLIYSVVLIVSYVGGFLSIQANTITKTITNYINISPIIIGIIIAIVTLIIITGGIKKISRICSKIVPIMMILYLSAAMYIIFINVDKLPIIIMNIITSAFNVKAGGFGLLATLVIGIQRGIFSNEAGLGTAAIAGSTVKANPASQGFVQMIGIHITTFLICTTTAFIILINDSNILVENGIEAIQNAFVNHLGSFGNITIIISIILFAFSTILSGYYQGETSLKFLFKKESKIKLNVLKLSVFVILILGCIISSNILWLCVNLLTAILAIINLYGVYKLRHEVLYELKKYDKMK